MHVSAALISGTHCLSYQDVDIFQTNKQTNNKNNKKIIKIKITNISS